MFLATMLVIARTESITSVNGVDWRNTMAPAIREAKKTGKPILLLSMFGRIDEKMPCANARTLRATLFKDPAFMSLVKNRVIPAWEMVRKVPKVTIDLGDGKTLVRTVRGNAVMYLCNAEGKVVDAFPGVYTAGDFMPLIESSLASLVRAKTQEVLAYHDQEAAKTANALRTRATVGKSVMESPTLDLMGALQSQGAQPDLGQKVSDPKRLRYLRAAATVTDSSLAPGRVDTVLKRIQPKLDASDPRVGLEVMKIDSRINVERVRPVIHAWLASLTELPTPNEAREAVLINILKIPYKDPYWGLKDVLLPGTPE